MNVLCRLGAHWWEVAHIGSTFWDFNAGQTRHYRQHSYTCSVCGARRKLNILA